MTTDTHVYIYIATVGYFIIYMYCGCDLSPLSITWGSDPLTWVVCMYVCVSVKAHNW